MTVARVSSHTVRVMASQRGIVPMPL